MFPVPFVSFVTSSESEGAGWGVTHVLYIPASYYFEWARCCFLLALLTEEEGYRPYVRYELADTRLKAATAESAIERAPLFL